MRVRRAPLAFRCSCRCRWRAARSRRAWRWPCWDQADLGQFGHQGGDGAIGDPLDLAESLVERAPERIGGDEAGDLGLKGADLSGDESQDLLEGGEHPGIVDEPLLVGLRSTDGGELAQAHDQRPQPLLGGAGRLGRPDALGLGAPGDDAGVDAVGLFENAHRLGTARMRGGGGARRAVGCSRRP